MKLRRATADEYPAEYVVSGAERLTVGKTNHLNGQYTRSTVWELHYTHPDGNVSRVGTFCNLRDIRTLVSSGKLGSWLQGKGISNALPP